MKKLDNILQTFQYKDCTEFVCSILPTLKYKTTLLMISFSAISATVSDLLGLKSLTILAFVVLCTLELVTGIYASVTVKKQKFQNSKATRFTIKLACILLILFVLNTYKNEFSGLTLVSSLFEWLHIVVTVHFSIEYFVSILENWATITGKSKSTLIRAIKARLNSILSLENETNDKG